MPPLESVNHGTVADCTARNPCGTTEDRKLSVVVGVTHGKLIHLEASPQPVHKPSRQPEAGSLNAIIREHCGTRLYVPAIAWTGDQVRLLNMAFDKTDVRTQTHAATQILQQGLGEERGECLDGDQLQEDECHWISWDAIDAARLLLQGGVQTHKLAMRTLLAQFGLVPARGIRANGFCARNRDILKKAGKIEFQFGEKTVDKLRPDAIFEMSSGGPWLVAYANFETISTFRQRHSRGRAKKLQLMEPAKACEDPYIMGMLVGLAQHQRRLVSSQEPCEGGQRTTLVGMPARGAKKLYIYTARIPDEFLAKLERPSRRSDCGRVVVRYESISLTGPHEAPRRLWLALRRSLPMLEQARGC